jgi:hypothetical protein
VLNDILEAKGDITASVAISVADTKSLTVLGNTDLTITGLTVSGTLTVATIPSGSTITGTITNSGGTIDLGTNSLGGLSITNSSGIVKTAAATLTDLTPILAVHGNITATAIAVGTNETAETEAALSVPNNTALTITTLTVSHAESVLTVTLGSEASTLTITNDITTNAGTIKTANSTVLATLLSKVTAGTVEVTDDAALNSAEIKGTAILKVSSGTLTINTDETLKVATGASLVNSGTLTNSGIIEAADVAKLANIFAVTNINGKVTVAATVTDVEIASGTTTVPANVTLTITNGQTLTLGVLDDTAATLALTAGVTPGKLVLEAGGKVNAAHDDSTITAATVGVTTSASVATKVKDSDTGSETYWKLTATTDNTEALVPAISVTLGKATFSTTANTNATNLTVGQNEEGAAGTLEADDTIITFVGSGV